MHKVLIRANKMACEFFTVQPDPLPGSFGDYVLYKRMLQELELLEYPTNVVGDKKSQAAFNMRFLVETLAHNGWLHCAYCGREDLVIFPFHRKPIGVPYERMATCDHILPRSLYPHLSYTTSNCVVACRICNRKKNLQEWEIKYPYPTLIENQFVISA